jgi:hypothetical protein
VSSSRPFRVSSFDVAVEAGQGHGQSFADLVDTAGWRDIDGAEGEEEEAPGGAIAMGDQIDLEEAWARIVPLGEGTNRDLLREPGAGPRGRGPAQGVAGARGR